MAARGRSIAILGGVAMIAGAAWLVARPAPDEPSHGIVVVPPTAPPPAIVAAPAPPAVRETVAAPPDAFVGNWRSPDDARLEIARAADRYQVKLTIDGTSEAYDGILQSGRVQIARGIDGQWIQALAGGGPPCLQLGNAQVFCRA